MKVKELIKVLKKYDGDLIVARDMYSEKYLLQEGDMYEADGCEPRPDGWVQNSRPDKPKLKYLVFIGN